MARSQQKKKTSTRPRVLARPLDALVFLLPLLLFYEAISLQAPNRVIAFDLLRRFFELFGGVGVWAPALAVVAILVAMHVASGERWTVRWSTVGFMYCEAAALTLPLLMLNWAIPLRAPLPSTDSVWAELGLSIGAGIYEELVFRLGFISLIVMIGADLLRFSRKSVAWVAIVLSSLVFSAHHHPPIGSEAFDLTQFSFRTLAGLYLAVVFWFRGYGSAAGAHAAYNVIIVMIGRFGV